MSASHLSRRDIWQAIMLGATAAPIVPDDVIAQEADVHCYLAQSGRLEDNMVIGTLIVRDTIECTRKIQEIRKSTSYFRKTRFKSTDRKKEVFCRSLIDHLIDQTAIVFVGTNFSIGQLSDNAEEIDVRYLAIHKRLLASLRIPKNAKLTLHIKDHGVTDPRLFKNKLRAIEPWYPQIIDRTSNDADLMQIAGYFTGLVRYEKGTPEKRNKVNARIADYAMERLQVDEFSELKLAHHPIFRVQRISA
ncbi:hypothetical protein [Bradyrhizobium sp. 23AC]